MKPTTLKHGKACRKFGQKMFLKAERCASPKCAFTRRAYVPGAHGASRRRRRSEYGEQLLEKQRIRAVYGVSDRVFKRTVRDAVDRVRTLSGKRNVLDLIAQQLELRIDNVVFRLGIAPSRPIARQFVSHGHIFVNGRRVTSPSIVVHVDDIISIRPQSERRVPFVDLHDTLKKHKTLSWLKLDPKHLSGKVIASPSREEAMGTVDLAKVVEFYAR